MIRITMSLLRNPARDEMLAFQSTIFFITVNLIKYDKYMKDDL